MSFGKHLVLFVSTGFYLGNLPLAPGTFGSLLGLPLWFFLSSFAPFATILCIVLLVPVAVWTAHAGAKLLGQKDPGCIVIDEIVGMLITLAGFPFSWTACGAGFALFRFFDALKPFPIRWVDRKIGGGIGIVLDDVLAGIIANITLRIIFQLIDINY